MASNNEGVEKNVSARTFWGDRAAPTTRRPIRLVPGLLAAILSIVALCAAPSVTQARGAIGLGAPVTLTSLPPEAQHTDELIHAGGPFPYLQDGVIFSNREQRLERRPRGYYHEYTVPTPGARDRGARRIVCGGLKPTEPDACFYTQDHYNSFHRILK